MWMRKVEVFLMVEKHWHYIPKIAQKTHGEPKHSEKN